MKHGHTSPHPLTKLMTNKKKLIYPCAPSNTRIVLAFLPSLDEILFFYRPTLITPLSGVQTRVSHQHTHDNSLTSDRKNKVLDIWQLEQNMSPANGSAQTHF